LATVLGKGFVPESLLADSRNEFILHGLQEYKNFYGNKR
jgi:hypothetical protein